VTLSTIGVLCQLGATVRLRDELEDWLPGFLPEDELEASETPDSPDSLEAEDPLEEDAVAEA